MVLEKKNGKVFEKRRRANEYEKALIEYWKKNKVFKESVENRDAKRSYVFYDGPPFITGDPHFGTLLSSILKDVVPRFWTMNGFRVERRWGWDCHGLPAENFVEKQLNITDRREIGTKWTLEDYITKCRESMVANSETWEGTIDRVGRWVDFRNAYRTMDKDFMESVWWAFKTLYEKGKIYEGRKVLMYDTKFCTPVSKAEVTMDNDAYKEVTDPSAYVGFRSTSGIAGLDEKNPQRRIKMTFLAWTTTPWTLPANKMLAVNPEMDYGFYEIGEEVLVFATALSEKVFKTLKIEKKEPFLTLKGKELAGIHYEDLLGRGTHKVYAAEFVGKDDGTGIVHIAPAYGEDDYALYLENEDEAEFEDVLDENGYYLPEVAEKLYELGVKDTDENGIECWAGNKFIAKCLEEKGIVWKIEYIRHEYPFNPRSKQRIMYRAFPSWFFDIQGSKKILIEKNEGINWFPEYLKHGRFEKNIEQAPDWNLSRDRFWATAMPVWKSDEGTTLVIGSYEELKEYSGTELEDYHRPWVDEIEFDAYAIMRSNGEKSVAPMSDKGAKKIYEDWQKILAKGGKIPRGPMSAKIEHFKRVDKVLDCWFESGSMPFAQLHYPFENKEKFEKNFPADFIVEYVGQVRAWFYYVHVVNTALFGENAYKNVITTGTLAGNDGRKMSKSLGNYTDPNELMDKYSADALRLLLLSSPVCAGEDFALIDKDVSDVNRKLAMIWNTYDFFSTYANIDHFEFSELGELKNVLDKWIVSRVYEVRNQITEGMEAYNLPRATSEILPFLDDLSNWFVRRSRRRFWKSEDDEDKDEAYRTLYYVLLFLSKILAPFTPFLSEELYQKLTNSTDSVHLLDWPEAGEISQDVLDEMARTREIISEGLRMRMDGELIKVRQPLAEFRYAGEKLPEEYEEMIRDEVNVKKTTNDAEYFLNKEISGELRKEGFARELVRLVQAARKKAGLEVDDRIYLSLSCELDEDQRKIIATETLAEKIEKNQNYEFDEIAKISGENITISLEKAK
ncbi:MAG: isoleucine--tRNA ligase [Candidatus Saccharibacteria bacterium]|nr:isoleucine--tRNA ligase [Candidatus Saccharibacteria bacterium]